MDEARQPLLTFPCDFPIKAMGRDENGFEAVVLSLVRRHVPDLQEGCVDIRPSKNGRFVSVTVTVRASSQAQLDAIYRELSSCEVVLMAL